ncbi:DUF2079 domain-containing protein [Caldiplasma sukawensis]
MESSLKKVNFKYKIFSIRYFLIVLVMVILYNAIWLDIIYYKFTTLHNYVYDLGIFYKGLFQIFDGNLHTISYYILNSPIRILISPISYFHSLLLLLYVQTLFLSLPAIVIFKISRLHNNSSFVSLLLSISYLFFFSLAGVNWFDVHAQSFFIFFFMLGYYFYVRNKYKLSILFFFLSGLVRFPYMMFPILFLGYELIKNIFSKNSLKLNNSQEDSKKNTYIIIFLVVALSFTIFAYLISLLFFPNASLSSDLHIVSYNPFINISSKLITIIFFFLPFLFIPFKSIKWAILIAPFFILVFIANNQGYIYPNIISDQYSSSIIPFLFLGTSEGLSLSKKMDAKNSNNKFKLNKNLFYLFVKLKLNKVPFTIFIIIILLAFIYQPYSPINEYSSNNYNLSGILKDNTLDEMYLENVISLIPQNCNSILLENNLPEVLVHSPNIPNSIIGYVFGYPNNLTFQLSEHVWTKKIQYVIADSNSNSFNYYSDVPNYSLNMFDVVQELYKNGNYGIMAEYHGIILLKYKYKGQIIYYTPTLDCFTPSEMRISNYNETYMNQNKLVSVNPNGSLWYGPFKYLPPGNYTATLKISVSNNSVNNSMKILIFDYDTGNIFREFKIRGTNFSKINQVCYISVNFSLNTFYDTIEFIGENANWNGTVSLYGIQVSQTSPL